MKKIIAFLCVAVLLISLCACTPKLEGGQPDGEIKSNGGIAVQQGDWIYFINGSMPELAKDALSVTEQAAIYRMNTLDGSVQQVTSEKAFNMYVYGDKIFYVHLKNSSPVGNTRIATSLCNGEINHREYLTKLKEIGYSGPIGLECTRKGDRDLFAKQDFEYFKAVKNSI